MKALIIGSTGQDGALLASYLVKSGIEVHGTFRRGSTDKFWRINELGVRNSIFFHNYNIGNELAFSEILRQVNPDYIFSLAGESFTALSFDEPKQFMTINIESTIEQLEGIKAYAPNAKVFFAGSSEVFGEADANISLNESSNFNPKTPYGVSKVTQLQLVKIYREKYGLDLYTGILFPHESPYRSAEFVTRKISIGLVQRQFCNANPLLLGDLSMKRDWGYAGDYVKWITELVKTNKPGEYVIGSGRNTSVHEFLIHCAASLSIDLTIEEDQENQLFNYVNTIDGRIYAISDPKKFGANRFSYGPADVKKLDSVIPNRKGLEIKDLADLMIKKEIERIRN
jgi:GDPmannose 4,6-dehydratase